MDTTQSTVSECKYFGSALTTKYCMCCYCVKNNNQNNNFGKKTYSQRPTLTLWLLALHTIAILLLHMPNGGSAAVLHTDRLMKIVTDKPTDSIEDLLHLHGQGHGQNMHDERRTRLRKRHSHYTYFQNHLHEDAATEWQNPCGGVYNAPAPPASMEYEMSNEQEGDSVSNMRMRRLRTRTYLRDLRRFTRHQYRTLQETHNVIDITKFEQWSKWIHQFQFLPQIETNSTIKLRKWYRDMQKYIGAFAYLGRLQHIGDVEKQRENEITHELHELLISARSILCEIETTINGSLAASGNTVPYKLPVYSRITMNGLLKFSPSIEISHEVPQVDLLFVKKYYFDYLKRIARILNNNLRPQGKKAHGNSSNNNPQTSQHLVTHMNTEEATLNLSAMMDSDYSAEKPIQN